ncbi:T9SS type A sorting domain-containing protein [Rurimicrobium arvi]|uniref:Secretion system C-terminal sorting domain-containing protein n=1 Tax=Rurimicrobium arvi TaxID=2049916 RepID=A0ABP8N215_9BACT
MPLVIPIPSTIHFNTTIAMDYLGSNNTVNGTDYVRINNFPTSFLSTGLLVGYYDDQIAGKDAALVLIDRRRLPSVDFGALGYDFTQITAFTGWNYYNISHAWAYPQRLSDHGIYQNSSVNSVDVAFNLPMGIGGGSSGSPVLNIASANDINSSVKGIAYSILNAVFYPEVTAGGNLTNNAYSTTVRFTRISALESAIRENCWKNSSRDEISRSGIYKQAVRVPNPKPALDINQTISTATDLLGSIAAFTETTTDGMKVTQLTANNCNIGSFTLPASYPASATSPWQVVVTAKQVDVNPGFSYTASGSSELDLTIVGNYGTESATSRLADTAGSSATDATTAGQMPGFKVYPNPSPDGLFYLELPQSEQPVVYRGAIVSIDGKLLQQLTDMRSGGKVSFNLSQLPQGIYILKVQTSEGAIVFTTKITL